MSFFGKKDDSLTEERLKLTKIYLQQQKEENSELRRELARLQELVLRNKLLLDDLTNSVLSNEKAIKGINDLNLGLEKTIGTNEETILKLEDEIKQLRGVKSTFIPTDFCITCTGESVQDLLDKAETAGEIVCFRDLNGEFWKIVKKAEGYEEEDEETSNIDGYTISVKLND
jgi:predicted RNase H-like nuclease (RuvC/YqgF family)